MNRKKIISPEADRNIVDDCPPLNEEEAIASTEENVLPVPSPTAKPYYAGIDIIKILAVFMVVSVHTYLHDGMYDVPIDSTKYILPLVLRWIAYTCVPLFMISTGYLMKNKKFSGKYYLGIIKILVIYIVASILCMICKHKIYGVDYSDHWMTLKGFLECYNADYAWYINYYVSIFMFIPFLNSAFDGMKTKGKRFALVATFVIFTIFSKSLFLGFDRTRQIRLFPDYLSGAWSVAYYFTGAFIREYPLKRCLKNKLLIVLGLIASTVFLTWSTYNQSVANVEYGQRFVSYHFNEYGTYPVYFMATFIFMLLCDITTKNKVIKFVLRQVGGATLATYLVSYVFDAKYYSTFNAKYPVVYDRWSHAIEIVGKNFLLALACGLVIHNVYNLLEFLIKKLVIKVKSRKVTEV